jgi:two-component system KDP operon response regulator KdpE
MVRVCIREKVRWAQYHQWLADLMTVVVCDDNTGACKTAEATDVFVIERALLHDPPRDFVRLRRYCPRAEIVVIDVDEEGDLPALLDAGADYALLRKSTSTASQLKAVTRRARVLRADTRVAIGDVMMDIEHRRLWCRGHAMRLTPTEAIVLGYLYSSAPQPVSSEAIASIMRGRAPTANDRCAARLYVSYLRRRLQESRTTRIGMVRGFGYSLSWSLADHQH